jgi:hypothetical protein
MTAIITINASSFFLKSVRKKNAVMAKTIAIWRCDREYNLAYGTALLK